MVKYIRVFLHYLGEDTLIDVSGGEVGLSEVRRFIGIVEFEFEGLGECVIFSIVPSVTCINIPQDSKPSLFPAARTYQRSKSR